MKRCRWAAGFLPICLCLFLALAAVLNCGGSGSGGGGGNPNAPSISSVYFSPSSYPKSSINVHLNVWFTYSDANGDLDNGTFKWSYDSHPYTKTLLGTIAAGSTSGTVSLTLDSINLNGNAGTVSIPVSLTDNAGNSSTTVYVSLTQT